MKTMTINRTGAGPAGLWGNLPTISPLQAMVEQVPQQGTRSGMSQRWTRTLPGYVPFAWMTGRCGAGCGCGPCAGGPRMRMFTRGEAEPIDIPQQISTGLDEASAVRPMSVADVAFVAATVFVVMSALGG